MEDRLSLILVGGRGFREERGMPQSHRPWAAALGVVMLLVSCTTSSVVKLEDRPSGCTGLLPVAALTERGINVELANLTVQQVALGQFKVQYNETMKALLSDQVLAHWVRQEMICQGSRSFVTPKQRIWYLTMKEVAERSSSAEFMQWLRENPMEAFSEVTVNATSSYEIESVSGRVLLPEDALSAKVGQISISGTLIVPGPTAVTVEDCSGRIRHSPKARVVIRRSGISCSQELIPASAK